MAHLSKVSLLHKVVEAILECGWSVAFQGSPKHHPSHLIISRGEQSEQLLIYIWNISHGGGRRNLNEYRIQITGIQSFEVSPQAITLLLGYWDENNVFAAWDINKHKNADIASSPSMQVLKDYLLEAHVNSMAFYPKSNNETVIAFSPSSIMTYVQNISELHSAVQPDMLALLNSVVSSNGEVAEADISSLPEERKRILRTFASLQRETDFRKRVLNAYANTCAVCGMQLKLVDAAHLVPVKHGLSNDSTSNGICLLPRQ
jgi:putative restriction endonuclease